MATESASNTVATGVVATAPSVPAEKGVIELSERAAFQMDDAYYAHATADHFWIEWRFHVLQQLIGMELPGEQILDVGCGNGVVQQQFEQRYGGAVTGCDLNLGAMEAGLPTRGSRYLYNILDERPQWRHAFAGVLLLDTLEHVDTPVAFLRSIRRHLVPGGKLVINVPATPWLYSRYDAVQGHVKRYRRRVLEEELAAAGFRLRRATYWGANLVPIALLRKAWVSFIDSQRVLSTGFAPPGRLAEWGLRRLMRLELEGWKLPWGGTSLAALAVADSDGQEADDGR